MATLQRRIEAETPIEPAAEAGSDDALAARAQADPAAFADLWERYYDRVYRYCRYRLPTPEDAEDAANDVFERVFAALADFRVGENRFRSWLFAIAHNEVASRHRRRGLRRFLPFSDLIRQPSGERSPEDQAEFGDEWRRVLRLLESFPDEQRRVLELRWSGLSGREIALALGKREDAVRQAESRALKRLRRLHEEETRDDE